MNTTNIFAFLIMLVTISSISYASDLAINKEQTGSNIYELEDCQHNLETEQSNEDSKLSKGGSYSYEKALISAAVLVAAVSTSLYYSHMQAPNAGNLNDLESEPTHDSLHANYQRFDRFVLADEQTPNPTSIFPFLSREHFLFTNFHHNFNLRNRQATKARNTINIPSYSPLSIEEVNSLVSDSP